MDTEQKWACGEISENQGSEGNSTSNGQSKEKISAAKPPKARLGRRIGSKNKPKNTAVNFSENQGSEGNSTSNAQSKEKISAAKPPKARLGRPIGYKNKPKNTAVNFSENQRSEGNSTSNAQSKEKNSAAKPPKARLGRPIGSKNKPKNTAVNCRKEMKIKGVEVAEGHDVIHCLTQYCKRHEMDVNVFGARGVVRSGGIYQPWIKLQILENQAEIISLTGYCSASSCSLTVVLSLGGSHCRIVQGFVGSDIIGSRLIASAPFYVTFAPHINKSRRKVVTSNGEDGSTSNIICTSDGHSMSKHPRLISTGQGSSCLPNAINTTLDENAPQMAGASQDCKGKEIQCRESEQSN